MNIISIYPCIPGGSFEIDDMNIVNAPLTRSETDNKITHRAFVPIKELVVGRKMDYIRKNMKDFTAINESELLYALTDVEFALFILTFS